MERRHFIRIPIGLEVTYQMEREAAHAHLGMAQDISLNGMRIHQYNPLNVGHRINVALTFPHLGKVHLRGVVVWCSHQDGSIPKSYQVGLRWAKLDPSARNRLNAFVNGQVDMAKKGRGGPLLHPLEGSVHTRIIKGEHWKGLIRLLLIGGLLSLAGGLLWLSIR